MIAEMCLQRASNLSQITQRSDLNDEEYGFPLQFSNFEKQESYFFFALFFNISTNMPMPLPVSETLHTI